MLRYITFDVTFPTGKRIARDLSFEEGTTAISGPNGTGKSLVLEMACYAMWGAAAVRGAATDYKKCSVELTFEVKGQTYQVVRKNGSTATLSRLTTTHTAPTDAEREEGAVRWATFDETPIATGTAPVNKKMAELLGYGYNVFSLGNLIGQGQIEALATMKPADRKKLVDQAIGLDALDVVADWCGVQRGLANKEAEVLEGQLRKPEQPVEPENYTPSADLLAQIATVVAQKTERDQLSGWLSHPMTAPRYPAALSFTESVDELQVLLAEHQTAKAQQGSLQNRLGRLPVAKASWEHPLDVLQEQLDCTKPWVAFDLAMSKMPEPELLSVEEIEEQIALSQAHTAWKIQADAYARHKLTCPACDHEFHPQGAAMPAELVDSVHSLPQLKEWLASAKAWLTPPEEPDCDRPTMVVTWTQADIDQARAAAAVMVERQAIQDELGALVVPADRSADYHARLTFEAAQASALAAQASYDAWVVERDVKQARLDALVGVDEELKALSAAKDASQFYERVVAAYDAALAQYEAGLLQVGQAKHKAEQFRLSQAAMKEMKVKVKAFLVPSLNKVASHLIQQMTAGQHQELLKVEVSEDFDITVDGQPLETLNGSGKTVANLAVRIALGQILTNRVFSVLLTDEVDAACDEDRSAAIANCLRAITGSIKQVISVSHKDIDADHYITL